MAAFEAATAELEGEGIKVVGLSTDDEEHAAGTVEKLALGFPCGYGLPVEATAKTLTAFYETRRGILHATGFVVRPDATVNVAAYSSGPIGRLVVEDVLAAVRFAKKQIAAAAAEKLKSFE